MVQLTKQTETKPNPSDVLWVDDFAKNTENVSRKWMKKRHDSYMDQQT